MNRAMRRQMNSMLASGKVLTAMLDHLCSDCGRMIHRGVQCQRKADATGIRYYHWPTCPVEGRQVARADALAEDNARLWVNADSQPAQQPPTAEKEEDVAMAHQPHLGTVKGRMFALMRERALGRRQTQTGKPAKKRGYVNMSTRELARTLSTSEQHVNEHEVVHMLHDLRKQGLVDFNNRKVNVANNGSDRSGSSPKVGEGVPVNLRVTPRALAMSENDAFAAIGVKGEDDEAPGPLDVVQVPAVLLDEPVSTEHLNGHGRRLSPAPGETLAVNVLSLDGYVEAQRLLDQDERLDKLRVAAALLREAGRDELADLASEEEANRSAAEVEYVRLLREGLERGLLAR